MKKLKFIFLGSVLNRTEIKSTKGGGGVKIEVKGVILRSHLHTLVA